MSESHASSLDYTIESTSLPKGSLWGKIGLLGPVVGAVCLILAFVLAGGQSDVPQNQQFFVSYLTSYVFWLSIGLGSLFFVLIQHGTRAGWSIVLRRIAENWMITLPIMGILILPLLFDLPSIFHWADPNLDLDADAMLAHKFAYFETGFYIARSVAVVAIWTIVAVLLYRWSTKQDKDGDPKYSHRMRWLAPLGFITFAISLTIASIDWIMALDAHWYSTIFGVYYFAGAVMASSAVITISAMAIQKTGLLKDAITLEHYQDLGKWTYTFVVFWAYMALSQFLLIWYANIPEETMWYGVRLENGWKPVSVALPLLHFAIPVFFMMSKHVKRNRKLLLASSLFLLFAHYVDMFWLVQPGVHEAFSFHIADVLTFVGLGSIAIGLFAFFAGKNATVPVKDPRLTESLNFENF